ncbi:hypothetical protein CTI14_04010 [Methylobacterium radiotolerans]|nr:hypothetical protein CTI14_04010 [Methylobacterium radiotolerans]
MIPPEMYWPPELLARAMPERYGHLMPRESSPATGSRPYTVKAVEGGCAVIRPQFGGEAEAHVRKRKG